MVNPPAIGAGQALNGANKPLTTTRVNGNTPNVGPPSIPYSARREHRRLDLHTVERKGDPLARDPPPRPRPYGLTEAPTFRPTEAEFRDPMEYIRSIYDKASKYGICKIVPPDTWDPDFAIDSEKFHFRTRKQEINLVEGSNRTNLNYLDQLAKFHKQYGTHLNRFPSVDKRPLDLYKLKKAVEVRGGFQNVCKDKKWAEIGRDLGYSGKIMSSLSTSLKNSYQRWLHPYEEWLKYAKPGVHQQMEFEYNATAGGSSYSPGLSQTQSPMNIPAPSQSAPPAFTGGSPTVQASIALNASMDTPRPQASIHSPASAAIHRPASSSGPIAMNGSGFAAVNGSGFTAINHPLQSSVKPEPHAPVPSAPIVTTIDNSNGYSTHPPDSSPGLSVRNPLKRALSHESVNGDDSSEGVNGDAHGNDRRPKRSKKDVLVPNPPILSVRPSTPQAKGKSTVRRHGDRCEHCSQSHDKPNILICDSCDLGYHRYCVDPPLTVVPDYEWHCSKCLVGSNDYGFEEGNIYSLRSFQEKANSFKENYFAARLPPDHNGQLHPPTEDEVEREFWRLVEDVTESVEVEYGADIHSTTHGSGFPTIEKNPLDPYSRDPWNLNVMPFHPESLFRHIKGDISGMTVPWLYVGMCFSTFCWHNEDHYAYSANYQHFGATKTWYGIPGSDALAFEAAMREAVPELFESQPDLLFQLVTILPPNQLRKAGVNVYALDQRAGQFVITFPQAYHAGFNHGFNLNEAVNFAPADWEPFGDEGVLRLQQFKKNPCFSHEELLFTAAASDTSIHTAKWLAPALERVRDRELACREKFTARHKEILPHKDCTFDTLAEDVPDDCGLHILVQDENLEEEDYQCSHCKAFCYQSQFRCEKTRRISCLLHPELLDCCEVPPEQRLHDSRHIVIIRHTNLELSQLVQKVVTKSNVPKVWDTKLESLLDGEARPALKALQNLLAEGEKIDYPLEGLRDLAEFVRKCNQWVDEANVYVARKQQNRRKNEKAWRRSSTRTGKAEERDAEPQLSLDRMKQLIEDGEQLGFSAPQMEALQDKLVAIDDWREGVKQVFEGRIRKSAEELENMLDEGRSFMMGMAELTNLEKLHQRAEWSDLVEKSREDMHNQTLDGCRDLLQRSIDLGIIQTHPQVEFLQGMVRKGDLWEIKAKEIMATEDVHYPQLEALHSQVQVQSFPVNKETLAQMDGILAKNREAKRQIITLVEKSSDPDPRKRPTYIHVRDVMKTLDELNGKPHGAADLEKQVKKHEDWMRKGKKLFGKANAPLHILEQHMKSVEQRNSFCFDLNDTHRAPVEPASREASPGEGHEERPGLNDDEKPVFCLCRQPEAGLMIECEICHDWYHAKCLKLARGKVKETEMFTCPICDWRVKIPRDAARPKLEDLQAWADEIPGLPFQPEEEDLLNRIIDKAQSFRDFLSQYTNGNQLCRTAEEMPEMLFYLRKIEGAEVLLAYETNVFRQELHKFRPIAPEPPPILDQSLSTRKPRPTKQQKLMKEHGVVKPEDLPPHLLTKGTMRRKPTESYPTGPLMPRPLNGSPAAGGSVDSPAQTLTQDADPNVTHSGPITANRLPNGTGPIFTNNFSANGDDYVETTPSPMFSPTSDQPHKLRDAMVSAAIARRVSSGRDADPSFPLFHNNVDGEDDLRAGLAGTSTDDDMGHEARSPAEGEYGEFFREMTNQEEDAASDGPPALEHETSQAEEALDLMKATEDVKDSDPKDSVGLGLVDLDGNIEES
ncbi:hypothetical protein LTS08_000175 [Lithohypha guttulata]|nr:hypothetical protein LTS08_000175 [Lithohypha guttulata]